MYFESIPVISTNVRLFSVVKIGRHCCRLCCYICLYFVPCVCLSVSRCSVPMHGFSELFIRLSIIYYYLSGSFGHVTVSDFRFLSRMT